MKARYERLVNIGLIKAVLPIIDFGKLENKASIKLDTIRIKAIKNHNVKITKGYLSRCLVIIARDRFLKSQAS